MFNTEADQAHIFDICHINIKLKLILIVWSDLGYIVVVFF